MWPEARRLRGVIIGAGNIARTAHLPAMQQHPEVARRLEVVAVVDPAVPEELVAAQGVAVLRDREAIGQLGLVDFVDICTPTATHVEQVCWALERGYHVLCEKPVATRVQEAAAIAAAARAAGRVVVPCHQYRYNPAWRQVRAWLEQGRIGRWYLFELQVRRPAADPGSGRDPLPWRSRRSLARGGVLLDHGTHLAYQLLDLAGPPRAVQAWTGRLRHRRYEVEDTAHLVFDYSDRLAVVLLTWADRVRDTRLRILGELGTVEWSGGTVRLEASGISEARDFSAQLDKAAYAGWFAPLLLEFADAMARGEASRHLNDITEVASLLEAAYRAAATGRRVAPLAKERSSHRGLAGAGRRRR